jgi:hypothetical protein
MPLDHCTTRKKGNLLVFVLKLDKKHSLDFGPQKVKKCSHD